MKSINESRKICLVPVLLVRDFRVNYRECIPPMWIMDLREVFDPRARCIKHFTRSVSPLSRERHTYSGLKMCTSRSDITITRTYIRTLDEYGHSLTHHPRMRAPWNNHDWYCTSDFWGTDNSHSEQGIEGVEHLLLPSVRGSLEINMLGYLLSRVATQNASTIRL